MQQLMTLIDSANPLPLLLWAAAYFLAIYTVFASLAWVLTKAVNRLLETRRVEPAQVRTEWLNSLRSIVLFSSGMLVPWGMLRLGVASVEAQPGGLKVVLDCLLLVLWNDLHFYAMHRLLHGKLKQAHVTHHKSVAATPFAAYSMSATEALLLGSVMPLAMLIHNFSLQALIFLPVWSICINTLSHSNCDLFPRAGERSLLGFIKHHQSHHSCYHGNYSFFFSQFDHWFGTSRPFKP